MANNINRCLYVIDGFYEQPDDVRKLALERSYDVPDGYVGWRTHAYQPQGIKATIERKFKISIGYWEDDVTAREACNGVFFTALARGRFAERVGVHYDDPPDWMMIIVYLTPDAPFDSGTSIWQHRETKLIAKPNRKDAARLGKSLKTLEQKLLDDSQRPKRWIEIDRIGNVFNRAVMFPGGLLHSATRHFGNSRSTGRLYQTFHFPIISR